MTGVITVHHTAIATADLDRSVAFYGDVLGLTAGPTPATANRVQWMYAGEVPVVHIFEPKQARDPARAGLYGIAHVALNIEDFDTAKAALERHGIDFSASIFEDRGSRQLFFDGPDGERIELIEFT